MSRKLISVKVTPCKTYFYSQLLIVFFSYIKTIKQNEYVAEMDERELI